MRTTLGLLTFWEQIYMGELKQHQPSMTIDEQIENLKEIGLLIENEEYAKRILNDISYFR